jgi:imidazolonepropionase-like amidohydrolase
MKKIFLLILAMSLLQWAGAQQTPAPDQSESILVLGATAHIGNGTLIENSAVGFDKGKITFVGKAADIKKADFKQVIDATGKHVYPGLIAPNTTTGLSEIEAVRATNDDTEVGYFNPNVRSIIAYNTDSRVTPTIRSNGVLMAQIVPKGGLVAGLSSVVELDAWNWEDAAYKMDDGIWVNWPSPYRYSGWWAEPGGISANKDYAKTMAALKEYFTEAKGYLEGTPKVTNLKLEAMRGLFNGSKTLFINTDWVKGMMDAVAFAEEFGLKYVLVGAEDAYQIVDFLKEHDVKVMLAQTHRLPNREHEDVDQPFKTPAALEKAGITFCLMYADYWQVRNLAFQAGQAVAFGLDKEAALKSVTLNTAKILGIDKTVGSLEVGKDATLIISNGDVLDQLTNQVTDAFIRGKAIDLDNKQKALYRKFKQKYEGK